MTFERKVENFVCANCGASHIGNGYTNHCPHCLWSRHVDVSPGDRAETCRGMMRPAALIGSSPNYRIMHVCEGCGAERLNNVQSEDSSDALLDLARHPHAPLGETFDIKTGEGVNPLAEEQSYPDADKGDREYHN